MAVQNKKSSLEVTKKHLEKLVKSKRNKGRDVLQGVKYSDGNIATATDASRALIIKYENENFSDSLNNINTLVPMEVERYPDLNRVIPDDEAVPNALTLEYFQIKEILTNLRQIKKLKIKNVAISFEESSDTTQCYLVNWQTDAEEVDAGIKLYLGNVAKTKNNKVVLNTEYFLNMIQFVKDTKASATFKFGSSVMPIVCENTLVDQFTYQYVLCPVRTY